MTGRVHINSIEPGVSVRAIPADAAGNSVTGVAVAQKATLTAQNTFTTAASIRGNFNASISGTWAGTLTLQRSFSDAPTTWFDVKAYTANAEERGLEAESGVLYRLGFKTGDYTSGSAAVRVSQ